MACEDAAQYSYCECAQISYALLPRVLRYVPLCMHARVMESRRNHESALIQAENGGILSGATYDMLHMNMLLRAHTSSNDCAPATLVLHPQAPSSSVVSAAGRAAVQCIGGDAKKIL